MGETKLPNVNHKEISEITDQLSAEYGVKFIPSLSTQLENVQKAFGHLHDVKGKRILDLGCGTKSTSKDQKDAYAAPWLCRALQKLGADAVGVDIENLEGEPFEHYELDLRKPETLNIFPNHSFDAITMNNVVYTAPIIDEAKRTRIQGEMHSQIQRLLKPNGKLITNMVLSLT